MHPRSIVTYLRWLSVMSHIACAIVGTLAALHIIMPSNWFLAALIAWANVATLANRSATEINEHDL